MLEIKDGYLLIPNNYKNKKITATSFYGLIGGNKFKPKGDYLLSVLGLLKEPFDEFYTKRGAIAERIVNTWLQERGYTTKTWDKFEINFDNFPKAPEVGGMIDIAVTAPKRIVIECKSKNIKDVDKIKRFPNLEQENQAMFYGYLSKCHDVKIIYTFFTDEQENDIRNDRPIDESPQNFEFYEKDLTFTNEDMADKISRALQYKKDCLTEMRIPLTDVSDKALELLGLRR